MPLETLGAIASPLRSHGSLADVDVAGITHDSRSVMVGDLYCALSGATAHGADFLDAVVAAGAVALLTDEAGEQRCVATGLPVLVVADVRAVMGQVAAEVYGRAADRLTMVGITGTNGKTTTAAMIDAALRADGRTTGLIGTIETRIADEVLPSVRTTPESTDLHALLAVMLERGVDSVVMEVSSHALVMGRVDGVVFDVVGFTNLSQDHLDFHGDMEAYFAAKASLFTPERAKRGVVCVDDEWGQRLAVMATIPVETVAARDRDAHHVASVAASRPGSPSLRVVMSGFDVVVNASVNVQNAVVAAVVAARSGASSEAISAGISNVTVRGRMERIPHEGIEAFVDYAHTPDAIDAVVNGVQPPPVVVVGAGGDRDPSKRAAMGAAAARWASVVIVTDDNPRSEDPAAIRASVAAGARDEAAVSGALVEEVGDRAAAIARGVDLAAERAVSLLVLGKGHEQGQEIDGVMHPFDDRDALEKAFVAWQEQQQ